MANNQQPIVLDYALTTIGVIEINRNIKISHLNGRRVGIEYANLRTKHNLFLFE